MASVSSYLDGRPGAHLRLDANDQGIVFEYGNGPDGCDDLGAREASVLFHDGVFHLFYDGAKADVGWRACLATSSDFKNCKHYGPVLELGTEGSIGDVERTVKTTLLIVTGDCSVSHGIPGRAFAS
jgi:predicted GH43/DUF377 family glycosyl hydrolase